MKPSKTLRTAIKVIDGKIVFQNKHADGCEDISFVKCFSLSLQNSVSLSLTPTECWHLELTFYNNESYVFHGDGFIFCCSDFFFKMSFDKNIWCIDGTFSTSPRIYAQVLGIHVPLSVKKSVVCCYILMANRKCCLYKKVFLYMKERLENFGEIVVKKIISDKEAPMLKAMKEIFLEPKFEYRSCLFHYKQSINRACRRFKYDHYLDTKRRMSLRTTLEKKKDKNLALRLLKQLSHLKSDDIREFYIERIFPIFKKYSMNDLDFYIRTEWLYKKTGFGEFCDFSIYNKRIRTSNICEIWHAAIRRSRAFRKKPRFNAFFLSVKKYNLDCFTTCIQYKDHECDNDKDFMKLFEYDDTMAGKESFLLQDITSLKNLYGDSIKPCRGLARCIDASDLNNG
uniref:MULE domain-containing protein n=1 Tax=Strongyloides venezuelensis TaxID=75913 RepID=A0A0K0F2A3_STRVS